MGIHGLEVTANDAKTMRRAVFLDRDGVVNAAVVRDGKPYPPASAAETRILPGVAEASARLKAAGFVLIVVTNQPDVARGTQTRANVEAINRFLAERLPIDDCRVCYHDDADDCTCRKPRPGLLLSAAAEWGIDCTASVMVGDRWKDIEAGKRAGCSTVLVESGHAEKVRSQPDLRVASLADAATWILAKRFPG